MTEQFTLDIMYCGKEMALDCVFQPWGYTYRINIQLENMTISFEPDEERNYRAIVPFDELVTQQPDPVLLQTIAEKLEDVFR